MDDVRAVRPSSAARLIYPARTKARIECTVTVTLAVSAENGGIVTVSARHILIDGGDGDQNSFGEPQYLVEVSANWFNNRVKGYGDALLFKVERGRFRGVYIALTGRHTISMDEEFSKWRSASVIVHVVVQPNSNFKDGCGTIESIGMTFADLIDGDI